MKRWATATITPEKYNKNKEGIVGKKDGRRGEGESNAKTEIKKPRFNQRNNVRLEYYGQTNDNV